MVKKGGPHDQIKVVCERTELTERAIRYYSEVQMRTPIFQDKRRNNMAYKYSYDDEDKKYQFLKLQTNRNM